MLQALEEGLKIVEAIPVADQGIGTVNGVGMDTRGFDELLVALQVGDATTGSVDVKLQESDSLGSGYTDITGAVFTQVVAANDLTTYVGRIRCKNFKRYIRAVSVVATAAVEVGAIGILGKFDGLSKVTQVNATVFALDYVTDGGTASV